QVLPRTGDALHVGLPTQFAFGADFARDAGHFGRERAQLIDHRVDRVLELEDLALDVDGDLLRQVTARHSLGHIGDVAYLAGQITGHEVHAVGQVLPRASDTPHLRLAAEDAFGADFPRDARHFGGERRQLIDHRVDDVLELEDLALDVDSDLLRQVAVCNGLRDVGDVAHLTGQFARHEVDAVRQVLPRAGDALHVRLATEAAFGAHLARHARDFRCKRSELVHHRVDRVLELEDLA